MRVAADVRLGFIFRVFDTVGASALSFDALVAMVRALAFHHQYRSWSLDQKRPWRVVGRSCATSSTSSSSAAASSSNSTDTPTSPSVPSASSGDVGESRMEAPTGVEQDIAAAATSALKGHLDSVAQIASGGGASSGEPTATPPPATLSMAQSAACSSSSDGSSAPSRFEASNALPASPTPAVSSSSSGEPDHSHSQGQRIVPQPVRSSGTTGIDADCPDEFEFNGDCLGYDSECSAAQVAKLILDDVGRDGPPGAVVQLNQRNAANPKSGQGMQSSAIDSASTSTSASDGASIDIDSRALSSAGFAFWAASHSGRRQLLADLCLIGAAHYGVRPLSGMTEREVIFEVRESPEVRRHLWSFQRR